MNKALRNDWTAYAREHGLLKGDVPVEAPKANKYGAKKIQADGITFDSKAESQRFFELKLMQQAGQITDLEIQPVFPLHVMALWRSGPIQLHTVGIFKADFRYVDQQSGEIVVEDVKSQPTKTEAYALRKKLAEAIHGIHVREICQ